MWNYSMCSSLWQSPAAAAAAAAAAQGQASIPIPCGYKTIIMSTICGKFHLSDDHMRCLILGTTNNSIWLYDHNYVNYLGKFHLSDYPIRCLSSLPASPMSSPVSKP